LLRAKNEVGIGQGEKNVFLLLGQREKEFWPLLRIKGPTPSLGPTSWRGGRDSGVRSKSLSREGRGA